MVRYYLSKATQQLGVLLRGLRFRRFTHADIKRMRREMFETYAPTTEILDKPRSSVNGTVVDGDLL